MAIAQINNWTEDFSNMRPLVYYKWVWSASWRYAYDWEALSATWKAQETGSAMFRIRYGYGTDVDWRSLRNTEILQSYAYCYVQVRGLWHGYEYVLWVGVVPVEHFNLLGRSGSNYTADQVIEAYTLDWLLETRLEGAVVEPVGANENTEPIVIDHLPTFNKRFEYGGPIIGNASYTWYEYYGYVFADAGYPWTNWDILEYLLFNYQRFNGPKFRISCDNGVYRALVNTVGVYDFNNMTLRQAINILLSPARGLSWAAFVDNGGGAFVVPFSLLDRPINFGGFVMPANPNRVYQDLWNSKEMEVVVTSDIRATYDAIVVKGERVKSCCTLKVSDGKLVKGWSDAEWDDYWDAAKNTPGYWALAEGEKAELNDSYRSTDKLSRVYTTWQIPRNWNWRVGTYQQWFINPQLDRNGRLTNYQASYWNVDKRILNWLPFLAGVDYSGWVPVNVNAEGAEPEFQKLLVLGSKEANKYQNVDTMTPYGASIRPLEREMAIEIKFSPAYLLAKDHLGGFEPGMHYPGDVLDSGIVYLTMMATVFMETDQNACVWYNLNNYENKRILEIIVPHAEFWYVAAETVCGVNASGYLQYYGGPRAIRDDTQMLRSILAAALAWYGRQHNKISLKSKVLCQGLPVGTLISNLDVSGVGAAGSVVTNVGWDFQNMTTSVSTDFAEPDIASIFELKKSKVR